MTLNELYQFADQHISIYDWNLCGIKGLAVKSKCYHIALNKKIIANKREESLVLAHELGHCETDQFYFLQDINNPLYRQNIQKAERLAKDYAYELLISIDAIKAAIPLFSNDFEIAEYFDIDINTFQDIVQYYKRKNLI